MYVWIKKCVRRFLKANMRPACPAFSLLEMGCVLIIMGCMLGASLPFLNSNTKQKRNEETYASFESIAYSLGVFLHHHKRLPCPTSLESMNTDNFGREDLSHCDAPGIIPYKTLGLSPAAAKDGAQHYITYRVQSEFCDAPLSFEGSDNVVSNLLNILQKPLLQQNLSHNYWGITPNNSLCIIDEHQKPIAEDEKMSPPFVLVSHGMLGGDVMQCGNYRPFITEHTLKKINSDSSVYYIDAPPQKGFDDHIFYKDRFIFARQYAGITEPF